MKKGLRYTFLLIVASWAVLGCVPPARAESFARVSDMKGVLSLKGGDDGQEAPATINLLLREGDRLETGSDATAEVEMPGQARLRMGSRSELRIKSYGESNNRDEVVLEKGGVFIDDRDGSAVVETLSAAVSPNSGSAVRVDADRNGTRVRVTSGSAQVQTFEDGRYSPRPMLLRTDEEMILDVNARPEGPYVFHASNDRLDRYQKDREGELGQATAGQDQHLDQPLMGSDELDRHGEWVTASGTAVWRPRVGTGWRPYSDGYWAWYDPYGWTWISDEPWGYVTFHYGAWNYDPFFGWCWYPGYAWRPAYVSWIAVGPYYAWAPLDPWGRVPLVTNVNVVVINGARFDHRVFTVAPRTAFAVDRRAFRPGGGRVVPFEMRNNRVIHAADHRVFTENRNAEPIRDFNAAQPVRPETRTNPVRDQLLGAERGERSVRGELPRPGRATPREGVPSERGGMKMPSGRSAEIPHSQIPRGGPDRSRPDQRREPAVGRENPARTEGLPPVDRRINRPSRDAEIRRDGAVPDRRPMGSEGPGRMRENRGAAPVAPRIERRSAPAPGGAPPGMGRGPETGQRGPTGHTGGRNLKRGGHKPLGSEKERVQGPGGR